MIQTITQLRKVCIAGCAIALCSLGLQAQDAELVKINLTTISKRQRRLLQLQQYPFSPS